MSTPATEMPYTAEDIYNLAVADGDIPAAFVNIQDEDGNTALHLASQDVNFGAVQALLAADADPNTKNNRGKTPLHRAVLWGNVDAIQAFQILQVLLAAGADPQAKDNSGIIPLHCAAVSGHTPAVQILTKAGAGLWEEHFVAARAKAVGEFSPTISAELTRLENSLLTTPQEHPHLNFNLFPPERIDEIETCLETLASEYEKPSPKSTPLKSLCLAGLPLTERCVNALTRIIISNPNIITHLDLSGQSIQPGSPAGNLLEFLLTSRKLAQLTLLNPDFTEADIHHLNSLCRGQRFFTDLPKFYLMGTPIVLKSLAEADHNLRLATHLVTKGGAVCPQLPSLSSLIGTQLKSWLAHSFFAPPNAAVATASVLAGDAFLPREETTKVAQFRKAPFVRTYPR